MWLWRRGSTSRRPEVCLDGATFWDSRSTWFGVNTWSTHGQHMLWNLQKINLHVFWFWQAPYIAIWSSNIAIFRTSTINIIYPFIIIYIFCFHDFPIKKTYIFVMSSHQNGFFRRWFEMWSATETMPRWKSTFCRLDGGCQWAFPVDFPVKKKTLMDSLWNAKTVRKWGKNFTHAKFI